MSEENDSVERVVVLRFPVLNATNYSEDTPRYVKWGALSENMATTNHSQTLKRLAERGGLSAEEIMANILGISWWEFKDLNMSKDNVIAKLKNITI